MGEFTRDKTHWLHRLSPDEWIRAALGAVAQAERAWARGDTRGGAAGTKRAAGMALNAALIVEPNEGWGRTYVEHLEALAIDSGVPEAVRAACKVVLAARRPSRRGRRSAPRRPTSRGGGSERHHRARLDLVRKHEPRRLSRGGAIAATLVTFGLLGAWREAPGPWRRGRAGRLRAAGARVAAAGVERLRRVGRPRALRCCWAAAPARPRLAGLDRVASLRLPGPRHRLGGGELGCRGRRVRAGDTAGAPKHYAAAPGGVPSTVGLARVRLARVDAAVDYAAARGNAEIAAAAADLERAIRVAPTFGPAFVELGRAGSCSATLAPPSTRSAGRRSSCRTSRRPTRSSAWRCWPPATPRRRSRSSHAPWSSIRAARHGTGTWGLRSSWPVARGGDRRVRDACTAQRRRRPGPLRSRDRAARDPGSRAGAVRAPACRAARRRAGERALESRLCAPAGGRLDSAVAEYREALRLDPKLVSGWMNLATALARDPRTRAEARSALERARALSPDDPRVKANLEELDELEHRSPAPRRGPPP